MHAITTVMHAITLVMHAITLVMHAITTVMHAITLVMHAITPVMHGRGGFGRSLGFGVGLEHTGRALTLTADTSTASTAGFAQLEKR